MVGRVGGVGVSGPGAGAGGGMSGVEVGGFSG